MDRRNFHYGVVVRRTGHHALAAFDAQLLVDALLAVAGGEHRIHRAAPHACKKGIDQELCVKCGECMVACPPDYDAVVKISPAHLAPVTAVMRDMGIDLLTIERVRYAIANHITQSPLHPLENLALYDAEIAIENPDLRLRPGTDTIWQSWHRFGVEVGRITRLAVRENGGYLALVAQKPEAP